MEETLLTSPSRRGRSILGVALKRLAVFLIATAFILDLANARIPHPSSRFLCREERANSRVSSFLSARPKCLSCKTSSPKPRNAESVEVLPPLQSSAHEAASVSAIKLKKRHCLQEVGKAIRAGNLREALELLSVQLNATESVGLSSEANERSSSFEDDAACSALLAASSGVLNLCSRLGDMESARRTLRLLNERGLLLSPLCPEVAASFVGAASAVGDACSAALMLKLTLMEGAAILTRAITSVLEQLFVNRGLGWTAVERSGLLTLLLRRNDLPPAGLILRALFSDVSFAEKELWRLRVKEQTLLEDKLKRNDLPTSTREEALVNLSRVYRRQLEILEGLDGALKRGAALAAHALEGRGLLSLKGTLATIKTSQQNSLLPVLRVASPMTTAAEPGPATEVSDSKEPGLSAEIQGSNGNGNRAGCSCCGFHLGCVGLREKERRMLRLGVLKLAALNGQKQLQRLLHFEGLLRQLQEGDAKRSSISDSSSISTDDNNPSGRKRSFTAILDAANIAYNRQNREGGRFSYHQVERVRRALVSRGERPLIILPAVYFWGLRRRGGASDSTEEKRTTGDSFRQEAMGVSASSTEGSSRPNALCTLGACSKCWNEVYVPNQSHRHAAGKGSSVAELQSPSLQKHLLRRSPPGRAGDIQKLTCADRALLRLWQREKCLFVCGAGAHDDHYHLLATLSGEGKMETRIKRNSLRRRTFRNAKTEERCDFPTEDSSSFPKALPPLPALSTVLKETIKSSPFLCNPDEATTQPDHCDGESLTVNAFRNVLLNETLPSRKVLLEVLLNGRQMHFACNDEEGETRSDKHSEEKEKKEKEKEADSASEGRFPCDASLVNKKKGCNFEETEEATFLPLPLLTNDRFRDHRLVSQLRVPFSHWRQLALLPFSFFESSFGPRGQPGVKRPLSVSQKMWSSDLAFFGEEENAVAEEQRKLRGSLGNEEAAPFSLAFEEKSVASEYGAARADSQFSEDLKKKPVNRESTTEAEEAEAEKNLRVKGFFATDLSEGEDDSAFASSWRESSSGLSQDGGSFAWRRFFGSGRGEDSQHQVAASEFPSSSVLFLGSRREVTPRAQAPFSLGFGESPQERRLLRRWVAHFPVETESEEVVDWRGEGEVVRKEMGRGKTTQSHKRSQSDFEFETGLEIGENFRPPPLCLLSAVDNPEAWRQQEALQGPCHWLCLDNEAILKAREDLKQKLDSLEETLQTLRGERRKEKAPNSSSSAL